MQKRILILVLVAAMTAILSGTVCAAPSYLGTSGNIFTPDDTVLDTADFALSFHSLDLGNSPTTLSANLGAAGGFEIGVTRFDSDVPNAGVDTMLNAKYRLKAETPSMPSMVIGVVDATGDADPDGDPGFYFLLGKNLTPVASGFAGTPVEPIRGFLGVGTGVYNGFFAGASWTISSNTTIMAEYINKFSLRNTFNEKSLFNAGVRFAFTDDLRADVALVNGDDLAFGISYKKSGL